MQNVELTNDRLSLTVRLGAVLLRGPKGDPGVGVPPGGAAGQMLVKKSGTDYDTEWRAPGAPVAMTPSEMQAIWDAN